MHLVGGDPDLLHEVGREQLAAEYADRAGDGAGVGDDLVRRGRHEIAARTCHVAHAHDDGLPRFLGADGGAPDRIRGYVGAARAVDAEDDRLDLVVLGRGAERRGDRIRSHRRRAERAAVFALAALDRAHAVDERDGVPAGMETFASGEIRGQIQALRTVADRFVDAVGDLVAVGQPVDESLGNGLRSGKRPVVHQPADALGLQSPALRYATHDLAELRVDDLEDRLAVRRRILLLGEHIEGILVLVPLVHARRDAQLFQRPGEEGGLGHQTGQPDVARRLQIDLAERTRQIVGPVARAEFAERLGKRDRGFSALTVRQHRVAHLLDFGQSHLRRSHSRHDGHHPVVLRRALQAVHHFADRHRGFHQHASQGVVRHVFGKAPFQVDFQHDLFGQGLPAQHDDQRRQDGGDDDPGADQDQDTFEKPFHVVLRFGDYCEAATVAGNSDRNS